MLSSSHRNGETLRSLHDLTCADDRYFKSLGRDARRLRKLIRCLKCIKHCGKSGVEHAIQRKYINLHGKYDIKYGVSANGVFVDPRLR